MEEQLDYIEEENNYVRKHFDLEDILVFQKEYDTQIIRGEDYQYECYINKKCYYIALTPLYTLLVAIKTYKDRIK